MLAQFRQMAKEGNHLSQDAKSTCEKNGLLRAVIYMQLDCSIKKMK